MYYISHINEGTLQHNLKNDICNDIFYSFDLKMYLTHIS